MQAVVEPARPAVDTGKALHDNAGGEIDVVPALFGIVEAYFECRQRAVAVVMGVIPAVVLRDPTLLLDASLWLER